MSTVTEVVSRMFRDVLHPGDDQPVVLSFSAAATDVATSWSFNADTLAPDELDLLAPGGVVETSAGERALITAVDEDASTLTVRRGRDGTTAAAHAIGDDIVVSPLYSRRTALEAVKDEVVGLYPDLTYLDTAELTTAWEPIDVPAEVITPVRLLVKYGIQWVPETYDLMTDFPPSGTGKAIILRCVSEGSTAYFTYRSKFRRPSSDASELEQYGVRPEWERIVMAGAAATMAASRDSDQLSAEYVTEQLEREALPNEATRGVRDGLLTLRAIWIDQAARSIRAEHRLPVVYNPVGAR